MREASMPFLAAACASRVTLVPIGHTSTTAAVLEEDVLVPMAWLQRVPPGWEYRSWMGRIFVSSRTMHALGIYFGRAGATV